MKVFLPLIFLPIIATVAHLRNGGIECTFIELRTTRNTPKRRSDVILVFIPCFLRGSWFADLIKPTRFLLACR
jgi:hypothetical protein